MSDNSKPFVCLRSKETGDKFFTMNQVGSDPTKLLDGTVAYSIIGYADSVSEAQKILYGKSYV